MRPVLMLFVGTRGVVIADTVRPLTTVADVVVATSRDILDQRADTLDSSVPAADTVIAPTRADLLTHAAKYAAKHRVDGALSFSDDVVELTAAFAAERGLPGQPPHTMANFRDKSVQRAALAAAGLPTPVNIEITSPAQAREALAAVPTPAILKPTRGSGGQLAFVVNEPSQLAPLLREAFAAAPTVGQAVESDTAFIFESLIVGSRWHDTGGIAPYVSVESLAVRGTYAHLAVTDRFPLAPPVLETGMLFPSTLRPSQQQAITEAATAALRALDFEHGVAHSELMLTADGPVVIEVNARAGGALPYLFPMASDTDLIALAGQVALGELPARRPAFHRHAVFVAPQHPVGVEVTAVHGLDEVRTLPGVRVAIPLSLAGTRTDSFQHTMIAAVLGTANDPLAAVALYRDVMGTVRGEYAASGLPEHYRRTVGHPT
jgi:biotin carboxylase